MIEKDLFKRHLNIDISVATIGINRDDWYCHKPGMTKSEVKKAMLHYGFDVVPIINKAGVFSKYFSLKEGKAELEINSIESEDTLYYLTHVRDAVWKMKFNKRTHYFLTNGRDDSEICGLLLTLLLPNHTQMHDGFYRFPHILYAAPLLFAVDAMLPCEYIGAWQAHE